MEPEVVPFCTVRERRRSLSNDRTLNPSISGTEQDSSCSSKMAQRFPSFWEQNFSELSIGSVRDEYDIEKSVTTKFSTVLKTPRLTPVKASTTPGKQITTTKISHIGSKRDSVSFYILVEYFFSLINFFRLTENKHDKPLGVFLALTFTITARKTKFGASVLHCLCNLICSFQCRILQQETLPS